MNGLFNSLTLAVASAALGAFLKYLLDRQTERKKRTEEIRAVAYADFLRAVAKLAQGTKEEDLALAADSKARIAIYGSRAVAEKLSEFFARGGSLRTPEGLDNFSAAIEVMRKEAGQEQLSRPEIRTLLFGDVLSSP